MNKLIWHTEQRKINDLIPFGKNPRKLTDTQSKQLQKSLEKFNLVEIPAIDIDNRIIAGHQRLKILQQLDRGEEIIDVRVPNRKLTEKEFQEYLLRSNKNTGEWDFDVLKEFDEVLLTNVGFEDLSFLDNLEKINEIKNVHIEDYLQKFSIIVNCENEEQQEKLYQQFKSQNLECKILSL